MRQVAIAQMISIILSGCSLFLSCNKEETLVYSDSVRVIKISDGITIDNGVNMKNPIFNYITYENFLRYVTTSDHFIIVPEKDFINTSSVDKVVLCIRHDIDDNLDAAIKTAYRNHKYGITSSFFVLHTAKYYGQKVGNIFRRNDNIIYYLRAIQDTFGQEVGLHNDLVTLQLIYEVPPREYLKQELAFLRGNGINILGTTYHGSPYSYIYHYSNSDFWTEYTTTADEFIAKGLKIVKVEKDSLKSYDFLYEGGMLGEDYSFSDSYFVNGLRWNMNMINLDTIKPGKKVIIILHPQHWNGDY